MRLLLDTHAFLWYVAGDGSLSHAARRLIDDRSNERLVSVAAIWEMAIKASQGKLAFDRPFDDMVFGTMGANGLHLLRLSVEHAAAVSTLTFPASGHRDPFDRLVVAQCVVEGVPFVSRDRRVDDYPVTRIW